MAASQLMAGSPPSPFDQHPFCEQRNTTSLYRCIAVSHGALYDAEGGVQSPPFCVPPGKFFVRALFVSSLSLHPSHHYSTFPLDKAQSSFVQSVEKYEG